MAGNFAQFPDSFEFTATIPIRITDINYGNHVGNDSVLSLLHEARMQFLNSYGFSELDCAGVGLIMKDVVIEFKKEIKYGQILEIDVKANTFSKVSFEIYYRARFAGTESMAVLARTGMVCYDYAKKKIAAVPIELLAMDK